MTLVSDDPSWLPTINFFYLSSYFVVAASVMVIYDWVLTLGREVELVWRQRLSLMTILYFSMRYIGIIYAINNILWNLTTVSQTDIVSNITSFTLNSANVIVTAILGVIMIVRLYAMYQGSKNMLIFLIAIFLTANITSAVVAAVGFSDTSGEELILSGTYQCTHSSTGDPNLVLVIYILNTVWEVLALCLAVWIAVQQFRDLRQFGTSTFGDCLRELIKSHVFYFASFFAASCMNFGSFAPTIADSDSMGVIIYYGISVIIAMVQMFVLGPRLILDVRELHAKLVDDSDAGTDVISIVFLHHVHVSTGSCV
ncbi:uncharacterized protein F5147DRAFT_35582 [Suillus discolor]|uniref:DUF6533 domain-containing protein n=1 Tax=Suillus discolor TaxID=1912936 RepID=A0A9P7JXR3_9AGAM|nr:uncharacterized protein F5147DRAFT_35582 [Suillus discolor]KAG2113864.1 hypothetical protein F5147DRAFT_35582 [Suillus discolor]